MNDTDNIGDVHYELSSSKKMLITSAIIGICGGFLNIELNNINITAGLGLLIALIAIPYTLTRSPLDGAPDGELQSFKKAKLKYTAGLALVALLSAYRLFAAL